ncbi:aminodeoxychorismate lyase [Nocardia caishijiensis]|uniref:4-amino-4-deoxychorismate lyase n=1 Tax=Nocardia caishijiensis TaxID=184756 RepID=A0ABQ6YQD1_9NOCA|nr:aminodeoxychorismate lyase [Nocardia caishijiensis]KAF0848002.1 4-amino-4-deoxychorismate lyase [Nocardia caishijiensis]
MGERVLVTLDGVVADANTPSLYADDIGALRGDGVFETILVRGGTATALEFHLARLRRSAQALELPEPGLAKWRSAVELAVKEWGAEEEGVLRLIYTRGRDSELDTPGSGLVPDEPTPTAYVLVSPVSARVAQARAEGVKVISLARGISVDLAQAAPWQLLGAKTLSYATNMAALRFARRMGADDVIFHSTEHRVLEGPRSTVVIARDKQLITPPAKIGVLPGVTQRALFTVAEKKGWECKYQSIFTADLFDCDSIWLLSSVTLAARVNQLDGVRLSAHDNVEEIKDMVDAGIDRPGTIGDW